MKTVILLSALATIVIAVPAPLGRDIVDNDTRLNGVLKTIKRERKSTIQESPAELSLDHESGNSHNGIAMEKQLGKSQKGFRKPILVKKKFGYHIYRDSDEELAQAEPRENCRRQFRFKLCDDSGEPTANNMRSFNTEDIEENDVEHSLKMAKEAVEILQRDLQKIEESTKLIQKNRAEENLEGNLHKHIEQARQPLEQLNQNIGNLESLDLKTAASKEINSDSTISKSEEARMVQWKQAIENIQKNVEIVKNIEDAFKSAEHNHLITDEELHLSKSKKTETSGETNTDFHVLDSNDKARNIEILEEKANDKDLENLQDKQTKHAENDMETFATENKQVNVGLHSDSLKLENAAEWDITENVRHAENDVVHKNDDKLQDGNISRPQEKNGESSEALETLKMNNEEHFKVDPKSVHVNDLEVNQMSKKMDVKEELVNHIDTKTDHEKSASNDETMLMNSKNEEIVEEGLKKHATHDETMMKSTEDLQKQIVTITNIDDKALNENKAEEKDAQTSESRNLIHTTNMISAKESINQDTIQEATELQKMYFPMEKSIVHEKESIIDSHSLDTQVPNMRSVENHNVNNDMASKVIQHLDENHHQMREAADDSSEMHTLTKITKVKQEQELGKMREVEEKLSNLEEISQHHKALKERTQELLSDDKIHKSDFGKSSDAIETQSKIRELVDAKLSTEKQMSHENTAQKSVDLTNEEQHSNHLKNDQTLNLQKNNDQKLDQAINMRFVDESGSLHHNPSQLTTNNIDSAKAMGFQQRMSEMDFFNNLNSQHTAQLVQDKNLDFHTSSHINQGMSEWDRNQQQFHSMLQKPYMPWMNGRQRTNIESQIGNHFHHDDHLGNLEDHHHRHDHHLGNLQLEGHHHHDHHLGNLQLDGHHHHAVPMGRFVNSVQAGMNHEMLNTPMMRENVLENSGAMDLDNAMQPSMHMNMRDALDQNRMSWNYHHSSGKSGFGPNMPLVGSGSSGSSAVGVFPNANSGCGIPLLLSCSPSVVSGSLAKQPSLGYSNHAYRSGDDLRFYTKRDAQGINEMPATKVKSFATTSV